MVRKIKLSRLPNNEDNYNTAKYETERPIMKKEEKKILSKKLIRNSENQMIYGKRQNP